MSRGFHDVFNINAEPALRAESSSSVQGSLRLMEGSRSSELTTCSLFWNQNLAFKVLRSDAIRVPMLFVSVPETNCVLLLGCCHEAEQELTM